MKLSSNLKDRVRSPAFFDRCARSRAENHGLSQLEIFKRRDESNCSGRMDSNDIKVLIGPFKRTEMWIDFLNRAPVETFVQHLL
jgi:hypothetical protein